MSTSTARTVLRNDRDWPEYAPGWAETARFDAWPGHTVTFERAWTLPSLHRGVDDFELVKVQQIWAAVDRKAPAPESPPRIVLAGPGEMWADERNEEVARTLLAIVGAAAPHLLVKAAEADEKGEGT